MVGNKEPNTRVSWEDRQRKGHTPVKRGGGRGFVICADLWYTHCCHWSCFAHPRRNSSRCVIPWWDRPVWGGTNCLWRGAGHTDPRDTDLGGANRQGPIYLLISEQ